MEVNQLDDEELDYELKIRGYSIIEKDDVKRNLLRSLLKMGENDLETFVLLDAEEEIEICSTKLRNLQDFIQKIEGGRYSKSYRAADTKLSHLLGRIDRITTTEPKLLKTRSILLKTILHLMQIMEGKVRYCGNANEENVKLYNISPVTKTLILSNYNMLTNFMDETNSCKKDDEKGTDIFSHQGVALKKTNYDHKSDPIPGTLSVVQYKCGKFIEWKPTEVSFESENTDCEWDVVDTVRRRTCSTSSNVENYHQMPPIKIAMKDLKSYKIKHSSRQISLLAADNVRASFLFQCGNSDGFMCALRAILNTKRAGHSKSTYIVIGEREESSLNKSFNELNIFNDSVEQPNVWNFMRSLHNRPYETTMQTFSKLTDTLLYRTPEQRPVDAEVAELLTKSFHNEKHGTLESDYTIIGDAKNIKLSPRISSTRNQPLNAQDWKNARNSEGRITEPETIKKKIFKGGIDPTLRFSVWKYLLNYYPWNFSTEECNCTYQQRTTEYFIMKRQWQSISNAQEERFSAFRDRKNLIEKDVNRTDRTLSFYAGDNNPNLKALNDILMTYVMYNFDLGYVQGMSDLLSPILFLMKNEVDAFWCFVGFMNRMYNNFDLDQAGMKKQLSELFCLVEVIVPDLADYLKKHESANMFFCFRWLLVHFKREFILDDIMTLWEVIWTDLPCPNFHLLICVAILDLEKKGIMMEGNGFTEILKYVNELSCKMELSKILAAAESIYEQLKATGDAVPLNVRQIIGLAPPKEHDSDYSDEEPFSHTIYPTLPPLKNSDDNDSIIDDIERVTKAPDIGDIAFENFDKAIASNYY